MKNILVIGSINMDLVIGTPRMPALGETIHGSGFATHPGGKGANQAVAAARLGANTALLGAVGADDYGKAMKQYLSQSGVDVSHVSTTQTNTGIAMITVCGGDNCIILDKGANFCVDETLIESNLQLLQWADIVVLQLEIPMDTVLYAAKTAKKMGKTVVVNPAPYKPLPAALFGFTDILIPNQHEAGDILGMEIKTPEDAQAALYKLKEMGVATPVITLGVMGSAALEKDGAFVFVPAKKVSAVDTTGAGDSFIGGLCLALSQGKALKEGLAMGTKVAAIAVTRHGAAESFPTLEEIENG